MLGIQKKNKLYCLCLIIFLPNLINVFFQIKIYAIELNDLNNNYSYIENSLFNNNNIIIWVILSIALSYIVILHLKNKKTLNHLKNIQRQFISNNNKVSSFFNISNIGLLNYDIEKKIYYRDQNFYQNLGYSIEEIKSLKSNEFVLLYEKDIELINQHQQQLSSILQHETLQIKVRLYKKDKTLATALLFGKVTEYTKNNNPKLLQGIIIDVSDINIQHESNYKLEEFLKLALGEYGLSTWEYSKNDDIIEYNFFSKDYKFFPLAQKIFLNKNGKFQVSFKDYVKYVHSDDIKNLRRFSDNYKFAKKEEEIKIIHNQHRIIIDGITYTIYVRGKIIEYGEDGFANKILGIAHNITERINEDESRDQSSKLEAIGSLAGGVAHDFNNQLNGILGFTDLLQHADELKEMEYVQRYLQTIKDCGKKCEELTSQLLNFAQKGKERQELFNIDIIINNLVKMLEHTIDRSIYITTIFNALNHKFEGDKSQIQNAIVNVLLNSCDAMKDGGHIVIETDNNIKKYSNIIPAFKKFNNKNVIIIKVSDNGEGIPSNIINRIFEPFFTTKEIGKGTGMGLAVVFGIIKDHAGEIYIDSKKGVGTTVYMCLPVNVFNNVKQLVTKDKIDKLEDNKKLSGKILIIDDEAPVRILLTKYIASFGCEVITAKDGVEALEKYKLMKNEISLVISDISMPKMNGPKTLLQLKKINDEVKVILITGYAEYDDKVVFMLEHGALALIKKPLNKDKLYKGIRKALGQ